MSFDGLWKISIPTPLGKQEVILEIIDRDGRLSGTATQGSETVPFLDAAVSGERIQWSQHITKPMKLRIKFDLTRDGDTLSGTAKPGILPITSVIGTRLS